MVLNSQSFHVILLHNIFFTFLYLFLNLLHLQPVYSSFSTTVLKKYSSLPAHPLHLILTQLHCTQVLQIFPIFFTLLQKKMLKVSYINFMSLITLLQFGNLLLTNLIFHSCLKVPDFVTKHLSS